MIKNIILTSASDDRNVKGMITLENTKNKTLVGLKKYNFPLLNGKLLLGIKTNNDFYKIEIKEDENFIIEKSLNLEDKISIAILQIKDNKSNILVWGSTETNRVWKNAFNDEVDLLNNTKTNEINDRNLEENIEDDAESFLNSKILNNDDYENDEEIEKIIDNALNEDNFKEENLLNNENEFLSSINDQISELLNNYEEEKALENLIPNSKFVKVNNDDSFYIFGVIYENEKIRYIVYGLNGEFDVKPNDEYSSFYQWLPLNPDNPEGYGYYLMYQDALTGAQVEIIYN